LSWPISISAHNLLEAADIGKKKNEIEREREREENFDRGKTLNQLNINILVKLKVSELPRNSLHFMKPENSLPYSQQPAACLYTELCAGNTNKFLTQCGFFTSSPYLRQTNNRIAN